MNKFFEYERFFTMSVKDVQTPEQIAEIVKPLYDSEGFEKVYAATKKKKMLPYVAVMLVRAGIDEEKWTPVAKFYKERNEAVIKELDNVYRAMQAAGVRKMFVSENFGALLNSGRDTTLFASGDLDNCADLTEKAKIDAVFEGLGYTHEDRYSKKMLVTSSYYSPERLPSDFYFGLCWEPLSRLKLPCFINQDDFVDWGHLRCYKDTSIKLPPVEALLYICLMHITLHSFHRAPAIRLYADILNSCYNDDADWNTVYDWAKRDHTVTRMMVSANLASMLADVKIPESVAGFKNDKRVKRLLSYVYDAENECLNPEPGKLSVYRIEIACNDKSPLAGLGEMLFPSKAWLRARYGKGVIASAILHLKNLL